MKLSEIKGEKALDVLADLIEPTANIMADGEVAKLYNSEQPKLNLVKHILKNNKKEVIEILAILEDENPKEYAKKITVTTLPMKLLELINDQDLIAVFQSQGQTAEQTSSGSVTENTEVEKK